MPDDILRALVAESQALRMELRRNLEARKSRARDVASAVPCAAYESPAPPLLQMAEGLIHAHQAAKADGDGCTLYLIEDALFHVGKRLSSEQSKGKIARNGHGPG